VHDDVHLGSLRGELLEPCTMGTADLQDRRPERLLEGWEATS
jgi:hypothetical protein